MSWRVVVVSSSAISITAYALCQLNAYKVNVLCWSMQKAISAGKNWKNYIKWCTIEKSACFCWKPGRIHPSKPRKYAYLMRTCVNWPLTQKEICCRMKVVSKTTRRVVVALLSI